MAKLVLNAMNSYELSFNELIFTQFFILSSINITI